MDFTNKIPQEDFLRPIDKKYLEEIQARVDMGWRVRTDMQALINFAHQHLSTDEA
jgi:hypothetical protein